jgi:hypothetical protein
LFRRALLLPRVEFQPTSFVSLHSLLERLSKLFQRTSQKLMPWQTAPTVELFDLVR